MHVEHKKTHMRTELYMEKYEGNREMRCFGLLCNE